VNEIPGRVGSDRERAELRRYNIFLTYLRHGSEREDITPVGRQAVHERAADRPTDHAHLISPLDIFGRKKVVRRA
jgi:hypothetical protein